MENDENEDTLDLSAEASESYQNLLASDQKSAILSTSTNKRLNQTSSTTFSKGSVDSSNGAIPEYPKSKAFDSRNYSKAERTVTSAFQTGSGWQVAFEEACKLELSKSRDVFDSNSGKPVYEKMEELAEQLRHNISNLLKSVPTEPAKVLPNPKNKELNEKYEVLHGLLQEYEKELKEWQEVERTQLVSPIPLPVKEIQMEFRDEVQDKELFDRMTTLQGAPSELFRALSEARRKMVGIEAIMKEAQKETADLVSRYSKSALGTDVDEPKLLITSLTDENEI